jgi:predicted Rossmann-fold nucleotide-binding protein
MKVYTAHPIPIRHRVRDTICPAIQALGIHTINPFYEEDKSYRSERPEIQAMDEGKIQAYDNKAVFVSFDDIVLRDLEKIRSSDGLVAIMDDDAISKSMGIGTSMEIFYCARWCKKPVFVVTSKYYNHPWLNYLAKLSGGKVVGSLDELYSELQLWKKREELYEERKDT